MGIETYPSPTIGTNRKSNLSPCFRENSSSLSIANNRGAAESLDGHTDGPRLFCSAAIQCLPAELFRFATTTVQTFKRAPRNISSVVKALKGISDRPTPRKLRSWGKGVRVPSSDGRAESVDRPILNVIPHCMYYSGTGWRCRRGRRDGFGTGPHAGRHSLAWH